MIPCFFSLFWFSDFDLISCSTYVLSLFFYHLSLELKIPITSLVEDSNNFFSLITLMEMLIYSLFVCQKICLLLSMLIYSNFLGLSTMNGFLTIALKFQVRELILDKSLLVVLMVFSLVCNDIFICQYGYKQLWDFSH